jgi:hypothetical protein
MIFCLEILSKIRSKAMFKNWFYLLIEIWKNAFKINIKKKTIGWGTIKTIRMTCWKFSDTAEIGLRLIYTKSMNCECLSEFEY